MTPTRANWRAAGELLGKDVSGVRSIGNPKGGCRHCGVVVEQRAEDGLTVLYRPGTECCRDAITDRLRSKDDEINTLRHQVDREGAELPGVKARIFEALSDRRDLKAKLGEMP